MNTPILEMRNITKEFPGVKALNNVSFRVAQGEMHSWWVKTRRQIDCGESVTRFIHTGNTAGILS